MKVRVAVQLVEYLPSMHQVPGSILSTHKPGMVAYNDKPSIWEVETGGQKLKVTLG